MDLTKGAGNATDEAVSEAREGASSKPTSKRTHGVNLRPLAAITDDINKAERQNVFTIGKLLREAKAHFPHGKWIPYLKSIEWNARTAQLYMSVAELADKYETVSYLGASSGALYELTGIAERDDAAELMSLAIERLQASIARGDSAKQQRDAVVLTPMAKINPPETTELALKAASDAINQNCFGDEVRYKSMMEQGRAIIQANPSTEDELKAITDKHPIMFDGGVDELLDKMGVPIVDADDEDEADAEVAYENEPDNSDRRQRLQSRTIR